MICLLRRSGVLAAALACIAGQDAFAESKGESWWSLKTPPVTRSRDSVLAGIDSRKGVGRGLIFIASSLPPKAAASPRKVSFVEATLPLILSTNEAVLRDRRRIEILSIYSTAGVAIDRKDAAWLRRIAKRYGLTEVDFPRLLRRVDIVPPSLALAQAAEESGWGKSRFARQGKALFGQKVFRGSAGIVPVERPAGERYRVRSFDRMLDGVSAYLHNLNTHYAYAKFRRLRERMRRDAGPLDGYGLVGTLIKYSERREAYLEAIRSIMRYNGFAVFDRLQPGA